MYRHRVPTEEEVALVVAVAIAAAIALLRALQLR
jgi:GAF domain-containing protein